jgi:hypothetical protein
MDRIATIICLILTALSVPLWSIMAGFSPGLLPSSGMGQTASVTQRLLGPTIFAAIWLLPLWSGYFLWQTLKAWRAGLPSTRPAVLMVLPAMLLIGFILFVNVRGFAP